jgi:hypothetical protein
MVRRGDLGSTRGGRLGLALLTLLVAGAVAAPAGAVTLTLGPTDLSASDPFAECDLSCTTFKTFVPTSVPGATLTAPADGTITSWRVKGEPPTRLRLRVVKAGEGGKFSGVMTSGVAKESDGIGNNPSSVLIGAGEQIGIDLTSNFPTINPSLLLGDATVLGAAWSGFSPGLGASETAAPTETGSGSLPMFNATVELFRPLIVHMTSTSGPTTGGDVVVITGQHLAVLTGVEFGDAPAAQVIKHDNNQVIAVSPAHGPGVVEVKVETVGGSSVDSIADRYTYAVPGKNDGPNLAPRVWGLKFSPPAFRAAGGGPSAQASGKPGTVVTYASSEAARASFTVQRRVDNRYLRVKGGFSRASDAGDNAFRFTGRIRNRKLVPGSYRMLVRSVDPGGKRSVTIRRSFRVVR